MTSLRGPLSDEVVTVSREQSRRPEETHDSQTRTRRLAKPLHGWEQVIAPVTPRIIFTRTSCEVDEAVTGRREDSAGLVGRETRGGD